LGIWINHSYNPNTVLKWRNNAWHIVANKKINPGEEITNNYSNAPWYIDGPLGTWEYI
jgi:SET domain-containing protein